MKLLKVIKSDKSEKKWMAVFEKDGKEKRVHFGAKGYDDYTIGATEQQRENYRNRHKSGATAKADTPNALSYYILWGDSKSRLKNIESFKKRFNV